MNALATRLRDDYVDNVRNPALARDLDTAADVASEHASWRFKLSELAASLPAGNYAHNELLALLGKPDLAAAEPAFYAIIFDMPEPKHVAANVRMCQIDIPSLEEATEIVAGTQEGGTDYYRRHNAIIAECRLLAAEAARQ